MAGGLRRRDPAWKYGTQIQVEGEGAKKGYVYLKCKFCEKRITGGVKRLKDHLACTHVNVGPCDKVPDEVKNECLNYLKNFTTSKEIARRDMEEMIGNASYFGTSHEGSTSGACHFPTDRGTRGPMDRFLNVPSTENVDQEPVPPTSTKEYRNRVCLDVARFFYENGIPFNVARSPSWVNMVRSIGNFGRGFKPPSMYELRTWLLDEEVTTTSKMVEEVKKTWAETGVTIMSDGWSDTRQRGIINFLVNNPHGTIFLRSVDASAHVKDAQLLFKLLDEVVEEVGENLVVQVVTDNASAYKAAGRMLMEKRKQLYWTPCAAHCLDLMLEKLGQLPQQRAALQKAKIATKFIYNHSWVLSLMRKFTDKEIVRPAVTRFATSYLTLQRFKDLRQPLEAMFASEEWDRSTWAKKQEGKNVKRIIMKDDIFWRGVNYVLKTTAPLVKVLRMVDGERTPAMGFIYEAMNKAKEEIATNLGGQEAAYKEIWDIIDEKWDSQLHQHLHAAAYYLNPQFHYDAAFHVDKEVKTGLYACMDRLVPEQDYLKANDQLEDFHLKKGMFGFRAAQACYKTRSPERWWIQFGDDVPELRAFAVKVLSLTCSSSACERNWSTFNQVHTKRRNRLAADRLNKLVYVMYNKKLKDRHINLQKPKSVEAEQDPLIIDDISSDDEWITLKENDDYQVSEEGLLMHDAEEAETTIGDALEASTALKRRNQQQLVVSKRAKGK